MGHPPGHLASTRVAFRSLGSDLGFIALLLEILADLLPAREEIRLIRNSQRVARAGVCFPVFCLGGELGAMKLDSIGWTSTRVFVSSF